jgi:hypothetical protein
MTTRNRVLAGLALLFVLGTALVPALLLRLAQWSATVAPLTVEEIRRLHVEGAALMRSDSPSAAPAMNAPEPPFASSNGDAHFVAAPTDEQLRQRFCPDGGRKKGEAEIDRTSLRVAGATALYEILPMNKVQLVPANIAGMYLSSGEFDKARPYLREAVRVHFVEVLRIDLCGQLAWLEDDPAVAAALIEESLSSMTNADSTGAAYAALNALELAVVTGSDAMAADYFQRCRGRWPAFLELRGTQFPNATAWLANEGIDSGQK